MDNIILTFLTQLASQAPVLLVYLGGLVLALVFWQRCPRPSLFTLIAMGLLLMTTLVQSFLFLYLVQAQSDLGWDSATLSWVFSANAFVGSVLRAMAFGLLVAAVFIGRKGSQPTGPNQPIHRTAPASPPADEYGITSRPSR